MCDYAYGYGADKKIKEWVSQNYDLESLARLRASAREDLSRITASIEKIIQAIDAQADTVEKTATYKAFVYAERRVDNSNHVKYEVSVLNLPQVAAVIKWTSLQPPDQPDRGNCFLKSFLRGQKLPSPDDGNLIFPQLEPRKEFTGPERRAALAYIEAMAEKHGAEIVRGGWGWK